MEIIKQNDYRDSCQKTIDAKYADISALINRELFRAVLSAKMHDEANMVTVEYVHVIKSSEKKKERYEAWYVPSGSHAIKKAT